MQHLCEFFDIGSPPQAVEEGAGANGRCVNNDLGYNSLVLALDWRAIS
jgi:hypothetical protein